MINFDPHYFHFFSDSNVTVEASLDFFTRLVNAFLSDYFPMKSGVQLVDKNDFIKINDDSIYWDMVNILHPMK